MTDTDFNINPTRAYSSETPPVASLYTQMKRMGREVQKHFENRTELQKIKEAHPKRGLLCAEDVANLVEMRLDRITSEKRLSVIEGHISNGDMFKAIKELLKWAYVRWVYGK